MIVADASAVVAILLEEPEAERFREIMLAEAEVLMSPVGYWEAATRMRGARGDGGVAELDVVLRNMGVRIADATAETAIAATVAGARYGRGTPARLNLGDCFAYALAKEKAAPLLFKGADFIQTDLVSAAD